MLPPEVPQCLQRVRWINPVQHRMAVWTDGIQIIHGIDNIGSADLGDRDDVVNMDEARPDWSIRLLKIEPAHQAYRPMMRD